MSEHTGRPAPPFAAFTRFLTRGDFSDLYLESSDALSIRWEDGRVEALSRNRDAGAGLRFLSGSETRFGHVDLSDPFRPPDAATCDALARISDEIGTGLTATAAPPLAAPRAEIAWRAHPVGRPCAEVPLEEKIALLEGAFRGVSARPFIRQVSMAYGERVKAVAYLNSDGEAFLEERSYLVFNVRVTAERDGMLQTGYEAVGGLGGVEFLAPARAAALVLSAANRAVSKLAAPPAPSGEMPVLIAASAGGTLIHEAVGHSLEADAVLEGTSPAYRGRLGQTVAHEKLTVLDDPTWAGARGSFFCDDEGVPARPARLIENGVLKDYLYDRLSARRAGRDSNGHGRRESYAHHPIPRMSNTLIAPGPDDPAAVLASVPNGFLVTRMGGGQVNTATGDFVFEVEEGFRLRDGERTLVRGATLLGNGPDVLRAIDMVGSDLGWAVGTCGKEGQGVPVADAMPTVRVQKLVVGGGS